MAALVISMGVLAYGYDSAFIGTTITHESFKRDFGLLASQKTKAQINEVTSNITSICTFASAWMYTVTFVKRKMRLQNALYIFRNP